MRKRGTVFYTRIKKASESLASTRLPKKKIAPQEMLLLGNAIARLKRETAAADVHFRSKWTSQYATRTKWKGPKPRSKKEKK